jgi:branched-chain amino acid transport system substrate-binding protein
MVFDSALVIIDAIGRVAATGAPITRDAVRDAIQSTKLETIQGTISFDANGDIVDRTVSVFQIRKDDSKPLDSIRDQFRCLGVAPQS